MIGEHHQNKTDFISIINYNLKVAQSKFDFLNAKYQQAISSSDEANRTLSIRIEESIKMIGWRLEHFINSERELDQDAERSFLDTFLELEWRLKEFDLSLQSKVLTKGSSHRP